MVPIKFSKDRAEQLLEAIDNGCDIEAPEGGWTQPEMLMAAGTLLFGAMSLGPMQYNQAGIETNQLSDERKEAVELTFVESLEGAIKWIRDRAMEVYDNEYDEKFENAHEAILSIDGTEDIVVQPLSGFKQ